MRAFEASCFINRELSWLEFNQRVLEEALDPKTPLLERLKFYCIFNSNLDEFFEVRVAAIKQQLESDAVERSIDGLTPTQTFEAIIKRVRQMVRQQYAFWHGELLPALARHNIRFCRPNELPAEDLAWAENYYHTQVRPVLTPMAIDPAHPFPQLLNKSLNLIVQLEMRLAGQPLRHLAVVQVPRVLSRVIRLPHPEPRQDCLLLEELIGHFLADIFPGGAILGFWTFRVTRNSELYIDEEEIANLLKAVENELRNRRKGDAVRLELAANCPHNIQDALLKTLRLGPEDLFLLDGPLNPAPLMALYEGDHSPELRDLPFVAPVAVPFRGQPDVFEAIRERDILLHHPYEHFNSVVELLERAARDSEVLAIKLTLYRTGGDARIVGALMDAVNNGKQVTAVVELRARFDEANNIVWARQLEEAGVQVVYGLVGYKIHAKACLIVRREGTNIRRYVHLSTGNYNPTTARLYTDVGFLTCRAEFGDDVTNLFNLLTGISQFQGMKKLLVAPFDLHQRLLHFIHRETEHARRGLPARIIAKMNSLVDRQTIEALYEASRAGVKIELIVRGICCLRPGVPGLSANIVVRSIVDRYLEHSRIFYFENACQPEVFLSSADWMPRNFFHRIEIAFPIEEGNLRERVITQILGLTLQDNVKARFLGRDEHYSKPKLESRARLHRSQSKFMKLAQQDLATQKKSLAEEKLRVLKAAPASRGRKGKG